MREGHRQPPDFEVRPPIWSRLVQAALAALGTFLSIVVTITLIGRGTPWAVLAVLALITWCAYFYRLLHMAVIVRDGRLTVRNLSATRHLERSAVADVGLAESHVAKSPNQTVVLHLTAGRALPLDACARGTGTRRRRRRVEDFQRYLAEWAAAGSGSDDEIGESDPGAAELHDGEEEDGAAAPPVGPTADSPPPFGPDGAPQAQPVAGSVRCHDRQLPAAPDPPHPARGAGRRREGAA